MFELNKITRNNIEKLKAYSSARDEFTGASGVFLDANENPYGKLNRYPDPYQKELKSEINKCTGIDPNNIFIGNGSDEIIDLLFRVFCNPSIDKALTFAPTYGMYDVSAGINDIELIKVPLNDEFDIDFNSVQGFLSDPQLKLILICSPNNPTGNCPSFTAIESIIENFGGVVLIDEAYINFSTKKSFADLIDKYPNLIVSQTMSKAWGLAAARIGMAFGNSSIIDLFNKVKPPYNISGLNQNAAIESLKKQDEFLANKEQILQNKAKLNKELNNLDCITKVYPSDTNFFLIECLDAEKIYNALINKKIIIRNRNNVIKNCIRITVGTADENQLLIEELKSI
ncbi:MAG: histidinol-phosphate transaminase [Flavobacteriales bacterium]|nr:histidinol-phosphate transaminase [Flavobacteriales bacterium]